MGGLKITYTNLLDHKGDFGQCIEVVNQHIDDFPKSFFNNSKAIGLTLNRNKLSKLPSQLERFKKLERLDLSNNDFEKFPEVIGDLENLRYLNISKNKLTSLPRDIIYLRKLEEIVLDDNLFEEFPEVLFQSSVEDVAMRKNKLKRLPPEIKGMANLRSLVVNGNQLTTLPVELAEMPKLTEVFASSNNIKGLPENFCTKAKSLKKLVLQQNPLVYPSAVSAGKGIAAMRDYEKKHSRPDIPEDVEAPKEEKQNDGTEDQPVEVQEVNGGADETSPSNGMVEEEPEATAVMDADVVEGAPAEQPDNNLDERVEEDELSDSDEVEEGEQIADGDSDGALYAAEVPSEEEEEVQGLAVSEEPEADSRQDSDKDESQEDEDARSEEDQTGGEEFQVSTEDSAEESSPAAEASATIKEDADDQESLNSTEERGDQEESAEVSGDADETASQSSDEQSAADDNNSTEMTNGEELQKAEEQPSAEDDSPAEVRDGDTGEVPVSSSPATATQQEGNGDSAQINERLI